MTREEAKGIIQGKLNCMNKCGTFKCKCTDECDNCEYCYSQGNFGEQKKAFEIAIESLVADTNVGGKWIPCSERLPEEDKYILLSFANFILPAIGRYQENNDGSGNFYLGDEDKTLLSYGLIVNAWMPLPEPYKEE